MLHAILAQYEKTFWLPRGASTVSHDIDLLFDWILWICIFFFLLVTVLLVVLVIKYRHRPGVTRDTGAEHSMFLEITWTLIPSIIVVFLYYYGFRQYMNLALEPPNAIEITAVGQMWQWSFDYPNGYSGDPELHVIVNQPVRCVLESKDVIHSLYIPAFRVKKDVVPGRFNRMWFEATSADGHDYVTTLNIDGNPVEVGVDEIGHSLAVSEDKFSGIVPTAQAALTGLAGGRPIAPTRKIKIINLHNLQPVFVWDAGDPHQPNIVLDANGKSGTGDVQFSAAPAEVRRALVALARGADIPATQPIHVFADAEPFDIYCAAYCGTNHSIMRSLVIVHKDQADFDAWIAKANDVSKLLPAEYGKILYSRQGCSQCHSLDGSKIVGPSWKDLWGREEEMQDGLKVMVDAAYVKESILLPQAKIVKGYGPQMPPFVLKDLQINAIIEFMETISSHTSQASPPAGPATAPATQPATAPIAAAN